MGKHKSKGHKSKTQEFWQRLIPKMKALGKAPCDHCPYRPACAKHRLACFDYFSWYSTTKPDQLNAPADRTTPSRKWFEKVFIETQRVEMKDYVQGRSPDLTPEDMHIHYGPERMQSAREWLERKPIDNKWNKSQWQNL